MKLSIIIVSWQVKAQLQRNLQALFASVDLQSLSKPSGFSCEVFVVDNHSQDGTVAMVQDNFPQVKLIANKTNQGFAYAVNQVLPEAQGEYILLLNPDMAVKPDTLSKMLSWADSHPQAAAVSCKLLDSQGQTIKHVRAFPTWRNQLAVIFKLPHIFPKILGNYILKDFDYDCESAVDSVRGSFLLLSESALAQNGYLDERYFIWFEDVDYCRGLHNLGLQVWYTPTVECLDYVGQSFQQITTLTAQRYFRQSMLQYFAKWHPSWQTILLTMAWAMVWPVVVAVNWLSVKSKQKR